MKKTISFVLFSMLFLFATTNGYASIQKKLLVDVHLRYQEQHHDGSMDQYIVKNILKTSLNNHRWTAIENKAYNKENAFIVLSKIEKANAKSVTMKFVVLNTDTKPRILSAPRLTMAYGKEAQIHVDGEKQKIQLSVVAVPV